MVRMVKPDVVASYGVGWRLALVELSTILLINKNKNNDKNTDRGNSYYAWRLSIKEAKIRDETEILA